jgi:arylsulfatase A-like enzyme
MRLLRSGLVVLLVLASLVLSYRFRHDLGLTDRLRGTPLDVGLQLASSRLREQTREAVRCESPSIDVARPTDVILIGIDTLRASHLGIHGYPRDVSPHIDALAADSLFFRNARSAAPWTLPAFAAVFTGVHPAGLGIAGASALPATIPLLGEILCDAGYRTVGVVSHSFIGIDYGFARGFESWDESNAGGHAYVSSHRVTDAAISALDEASADPRPLFLLAHYFDPHFDYVHHPAHPFGKAGPIASESDNIDELRRMLEAGEMDPAALASIRDGYDSEIAFTDFHIGRLLAALREAKRYEGALIVLVGDHGEAFGERPDAWLGHTRTLYDEALQVPLLVKLPRNQPADTVPHQVSSVDVLPTILDVLGHPNPPSSAPVARSLLRARTDRTSFGQTRRAAKRDAIVEGRWKLIRDQRSANSELYDLEADPNERLDLAGAQPALRARLERALDSWLKNMERASQRLPRAVAPTLSSEERARLKSLGYAD